MLWGSTTTAMIHMENALFVDSLNLCKICSNLVSHSVSCFFFFFPHTSLLLADISQVQPFSDLTAHPTQVDVINIDCHISDHTTLKAYSKQNLLTLTQYNMQFDAP